MLLKNYKHQNRGPLDMFTISMTPFPIFFGIFFPLPWITSRGHLWSYLFLARSRQISVNVVTAFQIELAMYSLITEDFSFTYFIKEKLSIIRYSLFVEEKLSIIRYQCFYSLFVGENLIIICYLCFYSLFMRYWLQSVVKLSFKSK